MGRFVKICIVGGGNLAHVCAGVLASQSNCQVNMLTRHPEKWNTQIVAEDLNGKKYTGNLHTVSNNAEDVAPGNDIIFLCLPGFAIEYVLHNIKPYIENATVGSIVCSTGFFFVAPARSISNKSKTVRISADSLYCQNNGIRTLCNLTWLQIENCHCNRKHFRYRGFQKNR